MKTAIVSVADIESQGTLDAGYWTGKRDGETYEQWSRRTRAEAKLRLAQRHLERAQAAMAAARQIMNGEQQ